MSRMVEHRHSIFRSGALGTGKTLTEDEWVSAPDRQTLRLFRFSSKGFRDLSVLGKYLKLDDIDSLWSAGSVLCPLAMYVASD